MRSSHTSLFTETGTSTLKLVLYVAFACALMVADHHGHWLAKARYHSASIIQPIYRIAGSPSRFVSTLRTMYVSRKQLQKDNQSLRHELLSANARLNRLQALADQNDKLRQLLSTQRELKVNVKLAQLIDVDTGSFGNRIVLDVGERQDISQGQAIIDADGVMGQIVKVFPKTSVAMLITDAESAVPVVVARTGLRAIAYGSPQGNSLRLTNIPVEADVKTGDVLLSSGIGGTFPAGFPVGVIETIDTDKRAALRMAAAKPFARLNYSDTVLVVQTLAAPVGPPDLPEAYGPPSLPALDKVQDAEAKHGTH